MKKTGLILSVVLFSLTGCHSFERSPVAVRGVMDLRHTAINDAFITKLNGEWEFYWEKQLRPDDFHSETAEPDLFGKVPSYWTSYHTDKIKPGPMGYATYRLTVILPQGFRHPLGFNMPVFDSSYDLYINGKFLGGNGKPGKTEKDTSPWYEKNFFRFDTESDSLEIIINVANFSHHRGGFWLPVEMGRQEYAWKRYSSSIAKDWAIVSLLAGFSLFFLCFFIIYPRDRLIEFFSLAVLGLALRPLFTSNFLILSFVRPEWEWIIRSEYLLFYSVITAWYWFTVNLYPSKFFRKLAWIVTILLPVISVLTLILPVKIFSYSTFLYYPSLAVIIVYTMVQNVTGIVRKNPTDYVYFAAFILLSYGVIHDVIVSLGKPAGFQDYILTSILVVFVFTQAVLILYKWVKAFSEIEMLQSELRYMNRNLGILVEERTQEINSRKEEIEKQNLKIALQNQQMADTIQLKNKVFSVIAHDLRSPVVSILYMLNLLKEDEFREKYDEFANLSIQYAQQVINLLENMLVWGKGQEDKIKYSPGRYDLADLILTNLSIFKEAADSKAISMNFTQIGNSKAFFDKDLLDIIIRNLLSNALKYTPRGGRISILLKDRTISGEGTVLKVCDNGVGIPPMKQKYLFTATEIVSTPGTENEKGTGLGLKLCQELVKLNKGTLSVESKEDEGTCFTVTIPEQEQ